tara:strand:+ start:1584 stop:2735 length:1152 start_codon:yes stop_codon:yes gene_type:complete
MKNVSLILVLLATTAIVSCKKKGCTDETATNYSEEAKKDDGSCTYDELSIPSTYSFTDDSGNSTVSYGGQTDRLNQLEEMTTYMKSGTTAALDAGILNAMFENTDDNASGNFTFSSSKQLKNKCFATDVALFEGYLTALAVASVDFAEEAASGQAGTLSSGSSTYLFGANGMEYVQLVEKGLMGAVFLNQATNVYFGSSKMDVDNSTAVSTGEGKFYTEMEHHWDEAFGYFGAPTDFLTNTDNLRFWAKYCDKQNASLGSNATIMNALLKGRAVISQGFETSMRDEQIEIVRKEWERVSASQAVTYLEGARDNFGTDNAKFLHELSEAYAFVLSLKYVPLETRVINFTEIETILNDNIGTDFWAVSVPDLNLAIASIESIYGF